MDDELKQRIVNYAGRAYAVASHDIDRKTVLEIAQVKEGLAINGLAVSSVMVREMARVQAERINALVRAKADALLDAYELYGAEFDNFVLEEAATLRSHSINEISDNPSFIPPGGTSQLFLSLLNINTEVIVNAIACQIEQRKMMPKFRKPENQANASALSGSVDEDRRFALMAIEEARKSAPEDERHHPKVGAIVVKDGKVLSKAYRGESPKSHAEYIALEGKLSDDLVAGATVYTTLEPCTTRNHPKIPCAQRLAERKVARVFIGMLDPNPDIRGRGVQLLNEAGIETQLFPRGLTAQVEEMNREFIRSQKNRQASAKMPTADEDQSSWPDVILECQWPSLVHEPKIPGSRTIRNRPWMLRYRGSGAVYNVCVHPINFGAYRASFLPFPVPILTDTASVHAIICRKLDRLVITTHDIESLIHNPPSGCDVQQYAVKTDGNEGEKIGLEGLMLEVEIPTTIRYEDKNGNQFKIRYLLRYDTYMEKGEMIREGRIEKVAPK